MNTDTERARANMVEQQIRPWNVLTPATLEALKKTPREDFVPPAQRALAFADVKVPLGGGEVMLEPKVGARMVEALNLTGGERALVVGVGSGYLVAVVAALAGEVTGVEIDDGLLADAKKNLAGVDNVTLVAGDAHTGWDGEFDAVLVTGSLPSLGGHGGGGDGGHGDNGHDDDADAADPWLATLTDGGRLVGIEGHPPAMTVVRLTKTGGGVTRDSLFETVVPRLRGVSEPPVFKF